MGPLVHTVKVDTVTPQALAIAGFIGCEGRSADDVRALELSLKIVSSRIIKKLREDLSLIYSVRLQNHPSWVYTDMGWFGGGAPCDPAKADRVADEMHNIYGEFAEAGPTAQELQNAKKQVANDLDVKMREPKYWLGVMRHLDLHGRDLAQEKKMKEAYELFTRKRVQGVFKKYYTPARRVRVIAAPDERATPDPKPGKKSADSESM
jgi:predicted Zn-dependent peptidase